MPIPITVKVIIGEGENEIAFFSHGVCFPENGSFGIPFIDFIKLGLVNHLRGLECELCRPNSTSENALRLRAFCELEERWMRRGSCDSEINLYSTSTSTPAGGNSTSQVASDWVDTQPRYWRNDWVDDYLPPLPSRELHRRVVRSPDFEF